MAIRRSQFKTLLLLYGIISLIPLLVAVCGHYIKAVVEFNHLAHSCAFIISAPLGWLTYNLPQGSIVGISSTAALGIFQWVTVYALYPFNDRWQ